MQNRIIKIKTIGQPSITALTKEELEILCKVISDAFLDSKKEEDKDER